MTALPGNITAVGSASPITVEGLTNGITYTFTVKAVNDAGSSTASAASNTVTLSSTTESSPAPQPTPTPTPTPASTPSPTPGSTPVSEPVNHVFNSSLVDEKNLASAIESKIAEANKAGIKNELNDSKGHWAEKTIDTYVKLNFIRGYTNGQFKPNANITRAEFASLISRVFNLNAVTGQSANMSDISSHWAKEAIEQLAGAGVLGGYSDGTFRPNQAISREEIVVILSRIVNLNSMNQDDSKGNFTDLSTANSYATQAIKSAAKAGIVSGRNDGEFDPHGNTTRAEALTIIQNALRLNPQIKELLNSLN
ncbi:Cellulosome-anchoring protein precursor [compost metagenome]